MSWLLRNWHLKLSAVLLATILYTGLVFSGEFSDRTIQVRVEQTNVTRDMFVLSGDLGLVEIRYRVATNQLASVTAADFVARVDFAAYDMEHAAQPQQLPIEVVSLHDGVQILSRTPESVRVTVDRIATRSVPVQVKPGPIPDGLEIDLPVVGAEQVDVRGPASLVDRVDRAVANISIPASGIDVNQAVRLVPVDVEGQPVGIGMIDLDPASVSVQVGVRAVETQTTVAVRPTVEAGTPAPGFALDSLRVEPATVTIVGLPEDLAEVVAIATEPISIDGLSSSQTFDVTLELPDGISLAEGEPASVSVVASIVPSVSSRTFVVGVVCEGAGVNACLPQIGQMSITLSGSGEALRGLSASVVTPILDASGLGPGTYSLTPTIVGLPAGVQLVSISPSSVSVSIVGPATPSPAPSP